MVRWCIFRIGAPAIIWDELIRFRAHIQTYRRRRRKSKWRRWRHSAASVRIARSYSPHWRHSTLNSPVVLLVSAKIRCAVNGARLYNRFAFFLFDGGELLTTVGFAYRPEFTWPTGAAEWRVVLWIIVGTREQQQQWQRRRLQRRQPSCQQRRAGWVPTTCFLVSLTPPPPLRVTGSHSASWNSTTNCRYTHWHWELRTNRDWLAGAV